ncbi:MAG TPA: hypothetical protein VHD87_17495 [Acidimicrobiales bacterium]|nr:hypothetical protein [Acidimicrobiales bacterium]
MLATLRGDETVYHLLVVGHLLCVIVGFGSTFVYPLLGNQASKFRGKEGAAISDATIFAAERVTTPVIYGAAIFGLILVAVGPYDWSDRFVQAAIPIVIIGILFAGFVHVPNLKAMNKLSNELATMGPPPAGAAGPPPQAVELEKRAKAAARNGGVVTLIFVALVLLMVFKPL